MLHVVLVIRKAINTSWYISLHIPHFLGLDTERTESINVIYDM